jgi:hypothetical protein
VIVYLKNDFSTYSFEVPHSPAASIKTAAFTNHTCLL